MMIPIQLFLKGINVKLVSICALSLMPIAIPAVFAVYKPSAPKPVPKDRRSDAGTTRGCSEGSLPLTVLASRNYVGQTISRHPTFAWFVPHDSASKPIDFIIYEWVANDRAKVVRKMSLQSSPGVMKLSPFSDKEQGLQPGKEYVWQVGIQCNPDDPSSNVFSQASFDVVERQATDVQSKLNKAVNNVEKANIYAEAGLWYDALDEALKPVAATKLGDLGATLIEELAESEALNNTSELPPKERESIAKQVQNLKQIARSAR